MNEESKMSEYQYNYKAFMTEWKVVDRQFMKGWVCPTHGPKDYCEHYYSAKNIKWLEVREKYIKPVEPDDELVRARTTDSDISAIVERPFGYYIRNFNGTPPRECEYAWKTFYKRDYHSAKSILNSDFRFDFTLQPDLIEKHGKEGFSTVGYLDESHGIPRNEHGFYADGDAVLCVRPSCIGQKEREVIDKHNQDILNNLKERELIDKHIIPVIKEVESIRQSPESYIYEGIDPEIWAPIMENIESNAAKLQAEKKVNQQMLKDVCAFFDKYREQIEKIKLMCADELEDFTK